MRTFFGLGGSSDGTSAFFGGKTLDFSKFMVCPHGQGGKGVDFVRTFFMDYL